MFGQVLTLAHVKPDYNFRTYGSLSPESTRALPRDPSLKRETTDVREKARPDAAAAFFPEPEGRVTAIRP